MATLRLAGICFASFAGLMFFVDKKVNGDIL
jgi:hypothetical protein